MKDTTILRKSLKIADSTEVTVPTSRPNAGPTPGPWSDLAGGWIHSPSGTVADADPDGARHRPLDERRANARLIAQAPRMYAYVAVRAAAGDIEAAKILRVINASGA